MPLSKSDHKTCLDDKHLKRFACILEQIKENLFPDFKTKTMSVIVQKCHQTMIL